MTGVRCCTAVLIAVCVVLPACGSSPGNCPSTLAERAYGCGPAPGGSVTYQPDVVVISGGADAVRARSADGLTWTIKGDAQGADQLAPGKVMLATGLGAGRVLAVNVVGNDRAVTLGPVDIVDVIKDADIASSGPISISSPIASTAPTLPGIATDIPLSIGGALPASAMPLSRIELTAASSPPPAPGTGPVMPPPGAPPPVVRGGFHINPFCCSGGVGADFGYDGGGLRLLGKLLLGTAHPEATYSLRIKGGKIDTAAFDISADFALEIIFEAATESGIAGNIHQHIQIPTEFRVPVYGVPFTASVEAFVGLETAFSAKNSTLSGSGFFTFSGPLGFEYRAGTLVAHHPHTFARRQSLIDSITGLSVGASRIDFDLQVKFALGLGSFDFTTGLEYWLGTHVSVVNGSSLGAPLVRCHGARLFMGTFYGIGYSIPSSAIDAVNQFLSAIHVAPIERAGGIFGSGHVIDITETVPSSASICK
jgi:hypothetical protein